MMNKIDTNLFQALENMDKFNIDKDWILENIYNFNLTQTNYTGMSPIMYIIVYNKYYNWGFTKNDILEILNKFNLNQKDIKNLGIYDIITEKKYNNIELFNNDEIAFLVSKLNILEKNKNGEFIVLDALERGVEFNNTDLFDKILETKQKDIILGVYKHIKQIKFNSNYYDIFMKKVKPLIAFQKSTYLLKSLYLNQITNSIINA